MVYREITVGRANLDAQGCAELAGLCGGFSSEIIIRKPSMKCNAKSLMGVISAAIKSDDTLTAVAEGEDESEALEAVCAFLSQRE